MLHKGVYFTTTNNMYSGVRREQGEEGFTSMFAPTILRWAGCVVSRDMSAKPDTPTCNQAEVLYPGSLPTSYVQRVYVRSSEYADELAGQMAMSGHDQLEIVVEPRLFGHTK